MKRDMKDQTQAGLGGADRRGEEKGSKKMKRMEVRVLSHKSGGWTRGVRLEGEIKKKIVSEEEMERQELE